MKIAVDERHIKEPGRMLSGLARACRDLGHTVSTWYADTDPMPECEFAILWCSPHPKYQEAVKRIRQQNIPVLFVEYGWLPKWNTFHVDPRGSHGLASWAEDPLDVVRGEPVPVPEGDLLVTLQGGFYATSPEFSPWFANIHEHMKHMVAHSQIPLRFRCRPLNGISKEMRAIVDGRSDAVFDKSDTLSKALEGACAVATLHSTCGIEAMAAGLPVLCYGRAPYRVPGAVWCMDDSPLKTWCRTAQLKAGHCDLDIASQAAMIARLKSKQWTLDDLPQRLAPLLTI